MNPLYCSKGHENPAGSKFCLHCGEKIDMFGTVPTIQPGVQLGERYVIVRELGQGGFGRTHLAEDINRFRELCVLKEFSPQVQTAYVLQKAEELFQREATVLYKLQHPQIPKFREIFRTNLGNKEYLFLVQDFVEGRTYSTLLNQRSREGRYFSETEVKQLLQQLLPVLEYIHSVGVIHRDISPDNLILRNSDQLPVLIDFGGVKQVAATVVALQEPDNTASSSPIVATRLGKIGYAPPEQMQMGVVEPHSDLYALAATMLVLLTGQQPQDLIDTYNLTWQWQRVVSLSPGFGNILDRMLAPIPTERFQSARQVIQALNAIAIPTVQAVEPTQAVSSNYGYGQQNIPVVTAPATQSLNQIPYPSANQQPGNQTGATIPNSSTSWWTPGKVAIAGVILACTTGIGVWGASNLLFSKNKIDDVDPIGNVTTSATPIPIQSQPTDPLANYSPAERARKEKLRSRRQELGIDFNFYVNLVNQVFWDKNPSLRGRSLSDNPSDESLRTKWDATAAEVLEKLAKISGDSRRRLGSYSNSDRERWKSQVNSINVGSRSLFDIGDVAFFGVFPEQRGKNFIDQPIGQVWYAFVNDKLSDILSGKSFRRLDFASGAIGTSASGTLEPADGRVMIARLAEGQEMQVTLKANSKVLLSIYSPSGKLRFLEDSTQREFSLNLPESGFYEFVVASSSSQPQDFNLEIIAQTIVPTPTPTSTPNPTTTATPTPTNTPTPTVTSTPTPTVTNTP